MRYSHTVESLSSHRKQQEAGNPHKTEYQQPDSHWIEHKHLDYMHTNGHRDTNQNTDYLQHKDNE